MSLNEKVSGGDEIQYQNFKYFIVVEQKLILKKEYNEDGWITRPQQTEKWRHFKITEVLHPWEGCSSQIPNSKDIQASCKNWYGICIQDFPGGSDGKESACNEEDLGSIPRLGRSHVGGHGNPFQYSCLVNPMDS